MKYRNIVVAVAVLLIAVTGGLYGLRVWAIAAAERQLMTPYRNGSKTPAMFGVAYTPFWIDSSGRKLEASLVVASSSCDQKVAVLLFHGRGETISGWAQAQAFLEKNCVSSLVFDYSGFGASTPPAHIETLNSDAVAAYRAFVQKFPGWKRCVMGHSMGNAPMLHNYLSFQPAPDCVVVANGFSSVEDLAQTEGAPAFIAAILGGVWDNTSAIKTVTAPLMVIHSDADQAIPNAVAEHLYAAAPQQTERVRLHGFDHNALFRDPDAQWWAPVLSFLHGR